MIVKDDATGDTLEFPCGRWLATDEDDGEIHRDLLPVGRTKGSYGDSQMKGTMLKKVLYFWLVLTVSKYLSKLFCE